MSDLDAAARQALQDVLGLREEFASATEDLAELKALLAEIEAAASRDGDALGDELESEAAERDAESKRLEREADQSDDAADALRERWDHARDEVRDLMRRFEDAVSGFGEWLDDQDGAVEQDLRTLDGALDGLEDAARDAIRSNGEAVDSLVEQCEALREHDLERFETEGMEQAREALDTLEGTLWPTIEEAVHEVMARLQEARERLEEAMASATETVASKVDEAARVWEQAHEDALSDLEARTAEVEQVVAGLLAEALAHSESVDEARQALVEGREQVRERLSHAHDEVQGLLNRLRPLSFVRF